MQICSREDAEREIAAARKLGVALVALGEAGYPHRLQMIDDAPPLLTIRGHMHTLALPIIPRAGNCGRSAPRSLTGRKRTWR